MMPTKSFSSSPPDVRMIALANGTRVEDVADACRSAALAFAWSASMWGKRELALWLVGPYAHAVSATRSPDALDHGAARPASGLHRAAGGAWPISHETIARVVESAHMQLLDSLRRTWSWRYDAGFARDLVGAGIVAGIIDDDGCLGYAPAFVADMRLVDRVRSLFLADYLTRPRDYASFAVCPGCGAATFDFGLSHQAECAATRVSVRPRYEAMRFTLAGIGRPPPADAESPMLRGGAVVDARAAGLPHVFVDLDDDVDIDVDCTSDDDRNFGEAARDADVQVEVLGEMEIDIDTAGLDDDDLDDFDDVRDTIIDPLERAAAFP